MYLKRFTCLAVTLCAGAGFIAANASAASAASLSGAGSTLVQPVEAIWATKFQASTGTAVTYSAVGSGAGVTDASQGAVDFGASDAPSTAYPGQCSGCIWIPWALSATGIGYNLPKWGNGLQLNGKVLSQIFLGQITNWDNAAIKALNPGHTLPKLKITVVARSDASGDSYALTDFLSRVNPAFRSKIGGATIQPSFPTAITEHGNSGVAAAVSSTSGAIGYVSASYLITQHLSTAKIENSAGQYEFPNLKNISAAAADVHSVPGSGLHIVNPPKSEKIAYPISTFTNAVIPSQSPNAATLKQFLTYAVTTGNTEGESLDFAPLPAAVQSKDQALINSIS